MTDALHSPVVVMGVSGAGKTTVGIALAAALDVPFVDADDLHSDEAREKMARGEPLTDDDRWPWLARVAARLADADQPATVIACSALKRVYRDALRAQRPDVAFIHLIGTRGRVAERLSHRAGHFMPPALLESQLQTLEPLQADELGAAVSVEGDPGEVTRDAIAALRRLSVAQTPTL
ncbi:gluconokinase [Microbacterium sp. CCNWLW134]|uniref:gluconokinase n=1 Tax=Microbacterium sp. CCNWLW134 TaxID=3122064 RepID=UPI00300FBCA7